MHQNFKQYFIYIVIFAIAYVMTGLLTPYFQDMTISSFFGNIGRGVSAASATIE